MRWCDGLHNNNNNNNYFVVSSVKVCCLCVCAFFENGKKLFFGDCFWICCLRKYTFFQERITFFFLEGFSNPENLHSFSLIDLCTQKCPRQFPVNPTLKDFITHFRGHQARFPLFVSRRKSRKFSTLFHRDFPTFPPNCNFTWFITTLPTNSHTISHQLTPVSSQISPQNPEPQNFRGALEPVFLDVFPP